jgi:squalene-hopene/tetraprenyl-beta-curcumene cyclase
MIRSTVEWALRQCERYGWTPLRRRGLEHAENQLLAQIGPRRIEHLDFFDLIWHTIAARTLGYPDDSSQLRACRQRMRAMISFDCDARQAWPRMRGLPFDDTLLVLRALIASGLSANHSAAAAALAWLSHLRNFESLLDEPALANLWTAKAASDRNQLETSALPPEIEVRRQPRSAAERVPCRKISSPAKQRLTDALRDTLRSRPCDAHCIGAMLEAFAAAGGGIEDPPANRAVQRLRALQAADGAWHDGEGEGRIHATSAALRGLAAAALPDGDSALAAGVNWLIVHQQAAGGWNEWALPPRLESARADDCLHETTDRPSAASHTAFALLGLVAGGKANHPAARRAVQYLVETQELDGGWRLAPLVDGHAASARRCGSEIDATAWPLLALSRWAVAAANDQHRAADTISLRLVNAPGGN